MIEVEILEGEAARWAAWVDECEGNALHLPEIHSIDRDPPELQRLLFRSDGRVAGCALAWQRRSGRLKRMLGDKSALELPTAPAVALPEHAMPIRSALFDFARSRGCARVIVHPSGSDWIDDDELARYRTGAIVEFMIDLHGGLDAVAARMHKTHRKNIRRAAKQGVRVEERSTLEGLLLLRELQLASADRAQSRAEGFGVPDEAFFGRLYERVYVPGTGHLFVASIEDRAVAALAWIGTQKRVLTVRSGSLPEGYRTRAMYLLYDQLIRRAIDEGAVELNAGGVPVEAAQPEHAQSGLYEFKQGFGGRVLTRHGVDIPVGELAR